MSILSFLSLMANHNSIGIGIPSMTQKDYNVFQEPLLELASNWQLALYTYSIHAPKMHYNCTSLCMICMSKYQFCTLAIHFTMLCVRVHMYMHYVHGTYIYTLLCIWCLVHAHTVKLLIGYICVIKNTVYTYEVNNWINIACQIVLV